MRSNCNTSTSNSNGASSKRKNTRASVDPSKDSGDEGDDFDVGNQDAPKRKKRHPLPGLEERWYRVSFLFDIF
jgi:hypothetical protein